MTASIAFNKPIGIVGSAALDATFQHASHEIQGREVLIRVDNSLHVV